MAHPLRRYRFLILLVVEVAYWVLTRAFEKQYRDAPMVGEWLRTAIRTASAAIAAWLFWPQLSTVTRRVQVLRQPWLLLAVGILMGVALWGLNPLPYDAPMLVLLTCTSVPVAIHEEIVFRGIVQRHAQARVGTALAIAGTSLVFSAWHLGLAHGLWDHAQIVIVSCILGLVHARSGSLLTVIAVHAVYDAAWVAPLGLTRTLSPSAAMLWLVVALAVTALWAWQVDGRRPVRVLTWLMGDPP